MKLEVEVEAAHGQEAGRAARQKFVALRAAHEDGFLVLQPGGVDESLATKVLEGEGGVAVVAASVDLRGIVTLQRELVVSGGGGAAALANDGSGSADGARGRLRR